MKSQRGPSTTFHPNHPLFSCVSQLSYDTILLGGGSGESVGFWGPETVIEVEDTKLGEFGFHLVDFFFFFFFFWFFFGFFNFFLVFFGFFLFFFVLFRFVLFCFV